MIVMNETEERVLGVGRNEHECDEDTIDGKACPYKQKTNKYDIEQDNDR